MQPDQKRSAKTSPAPVGSTSVDLVSGHALGPARMIDESTRLAKGYHEQSGMPAPQVQLALVAADILGTQDHGRSGP